MTQFSLLAAVALLAPAPDENAEWRAAIRKGDFEKFKRLAETKPTLKESLGKDAKPMLFAVRDKNLKVIRYLELRGVMMSIDDVAELGDLPRLKKMLAEKPWLAKLPNAPLFGAAQNNDEEMARLLLDHGADTDVDAGFINISDLTPLAEALGWRHAEGPAIAMLERGARPHVSGGRFSMDAVPSALQVGSERLVRALLSAKADPYVEIGNYHPPLQEAAARGDLERLKLLVRVGLDPKRKSRDGISPLLAAAATGHREAAEWLLKNGAVLDVHSAAAIGRKEFVFAALAERSKLLNDLEPSTKNPLLWFALHSNDPDFAKALIAKGAALDQPCHPYPMGEYKDLDDRDKATETMFETSATLASPAVVAVLFDAAKPSVGEVLRALAKAIDAKKWENAKFLASRAPIGEFDAEQLKEVVQEAVFDDAKQGVRLLVAAGLNPNIDYDGKSLLDHMLEDGDRATAEFLVAKGAKIDFLSAVRLGRVDVMKQLLEKDPENGEGDYFLEAAAAAGQVESLRLLLGAKPDLTALEPVRPAMINSAMERGHIGVLQLLADSGFNITTTKVAYRKQADPSIVIAARSARPEVIRWLIDRKVDVNAIGDHREETALHDLAFSISDSDRPFPTFDKDFVEITKRNVASMKLLLDAGANVNIRDKKGKTPLHRACESRNLDGVLLLLEKGADPTIEDVFGVTPRDAARMYCSYGRDDLERKRAIIAAVERVLSTPTRTPPAT